jgi:Family of unknown function (DUF6326)
MNNLQELNVNTRIVIAFLWTAMLFIFAYVDIFGFFRADVLQNALSGKVFIFEANQIFFLLTTFYVVIPSLMVFLTLVLKANIAKITNIIFPLLYIVTIVGAMVGETWWYFILGSVLEIILLIVIIMYAWKWPRVETSN